MNKLNELIIAHRGESFDAPENTLASINLAWQRKVHSVEIDIQLTKDNELVVIHDYNTFRISGKKIPVKISSLAELKCIDAGSHKNKKWKNERIPTLREVLNSIPADCKLIIEIKSDDRILEKLQQELDFSNIKHHQIELIAFNLNTLARAKALMPEYKMLWLLDLDYFWPWWMLFVNKHRIIQKVKTLNLDGVDVWAGKLLTRSFILAFKDVGLLVYAWTVNNPEQAKSLLKDGIDGITTDRAAWMMKQIQ